MKPPTCCSVSLNGGNSSREGILTISVFGDGSSGIVCKLSKSNFESTVFGVINDCDGTASAGSMDENDESELEFIPSLLGWVPYG